MTTHEYKYGQTEIGMELLRDLGIRSSPLAGFRPFSVTVSLGDGNIKGHGFPIITWHFSFLTVAERAVFVGPLNGELSGPAFIRSRLPDGTWHNFECIQNIPTGEENFQVGYVLGFDIVFTHCVET